MTASRFGVSLNNRASVFLQDYSPVDMILMAERAEEMGLGSVWVGDSLIDSPRYEPLTILGAVAARTQIIKIGGSIIQPHFRNPIMLALSWATLDRLSHGRTILTLGTGGGTPSGIAKEAELMGISPKKRAKALEENIEILRTVWSGELLNHHGEIYNLEGAKAGYFPVQSPPPIWIAAGVWIPRTQDRVISATPGYTSKSGTFSANLDRVARLGDGWFTIMTPPEEFQDLSDELSERMKRYGRNPNQIPRAVECWLNVNADSEKAKKQITKMIEGYFANPVDPNTIERWSIYGTRADCIKKIEHYIRSGADLVKLIMGSENQLGMLDEVGRSILPSF